MTVFLCNAGCLARSNHFIAAQMAADASVRALCQAADYPNTLSISERTPVTPLSSRTYANPPIVEAILEVRFSAVSLTAESLRAFAVDVPGKWRDPAPMSEFDVTVGVGGSTAENRVVGVRVEHQSGGWILQFRQDRFVLSAIGLYPGWNEFESMAAQQWARYRSMLGQTALERIALRTINRINVPANGEDMREYFRTYPEVSPDLPQSISGFLLRVSQVYADENCAANIMQTVITPTVPDTIAVVLDVDLYQAKHIPDSDPELWNRFRQLHFKRNEIFEACITSKTRELFDAAN